MADVAGDPVLHDLGHRFRVEAAIGGGAGESADRAVTADAELPERTARALLLGEMAREEERVFERVGVHRSRPLRVVGRVTGLTRFGRGEVGELERRPIGRWTRGIATTARQGGQHQQQGCKRRARAPGFGQGTILAARHQIRGAQRRPPPWGQPRHPASSALPGWPGSRWQPCRCFPRPRGAGECRRLCSRSR